ncbi:MAG: PD-(D/E)XK motif protein, partial [Pseudonocardiaceae bacterium]
VVSHLIDSIGPHDAMKAWRGGDEWEEHDLGLADDDVEVKTTTSDGRHHWISTLDQLQPTIGRKLWLLSIQLTGAGASKAARLPDVVACVEEQLPSELQVSFQSRIARTHYRSTQTYDSFRLLRLRSTPACFLVDGDFPRIDRDILARAGASVAGIDEVNYAIRLDGMTPATDPPAALLGFGEGDNR